MSAGPVCSGCVGWLGHFTISGWNGGRGQSRFPGKVGARSRAAPPDDYGSGSVGVLPDSGSRCWLPTATSGCTQPVRWGSATATESSWKLPEAQLQAHQWHRVAADQLISDQSVNGSTADVSRNIQHCTIDLMQLNVLKQREEGKSWLNHLDAQVLTESLRYGKEKWDFTVLTFYRMKMMMDERYICFLFLWL